MRQEYQQRFKRVLSIILTVVVLLTTIDFGSISMKVSATGTCTHVHDDTCGYVEAQDEAPCTHVCTVQSGCITSQEETNCLHVHDEDCGGEENCNHQCSIETGCITVKESTLCVHVHDENCGYKAAVEGQLCTHTCEYCAGDNDDSDNDDPDNSDLEDNLYNIAPVSGEGENAGENGNGGEQTSEGTEIKYEKLEGYTFSININIELSAELKDLYDSIQDIPDYPSEDASSKNITDVKVYCGATFGEECYEILKRDIVVSGSTGTISDIPVYIRENTGSLAMGGNGEYISDLQYYVEIPAANTGDTYRLEYTNKGSGKYISEVKITKNQNDLEWTAQFSTSGEKLVLSQRETKDYYYDITFLSQDAVSEFPINTSKMQLYYSENVNRKWMEPSNILFLGNSTFRILYKVPAETIESRIEVEVPSYAGYNIYWKNGDTEELFNGAGELIEFSKVSGQKLKYIQNTELKGTITWLDGGDSSKRKTTDEIRNLIRGYNGTELVEVPSDNITITSTEGSNKWDVTISNLPVYSVDGTARYYHYDLNVNDFKLACGDADNNYYRVTYDNGSQSTETKYAMNNCNIILALAKDEHPFSVNLKWQDDEDNNKRAVELSDANGVTLYLWRSTSNDFSNASAVNDESGNQYAYQLTATDKTSVSEVELTGGKSLPKYNENGLLYYYFVTAVDKGSAYQVSYAGEAVEEGSEPVRKSAAGAGEDIVFTRVEKGNIRATVDWSKAAGETDYVGSRAVLLLQKRKKDSPQEEWTNVTYSNGSAYEIKTPAATASTKAVNAQFYNVDLFDPEGQTYEFRVIETGIKNSQDDLTSIEGEWEKNAQEANLTFRNEFDYNSHHYIGSSTLTSDSEKKYHLIENKLSYQMDYRMYIN